MKKNEAEEWRLEAIEKAERRETTLRKEAWEKIEKGARDLQKEKGLSYVDALSEFMSTPTGTMAYELYNAGVRLGEPSEIENQVRKEEPQDEVDREICAKIDELVQKGNEKLSYSQAFERVMKENPELAEKWSRSAVNVGAVVK